MEDPADPTLHLRNLNKQLRGITEKWQVLGLSFTLGLQKLSILDCKPYEVEQQKQQLLEQWLEDLTASWQKLVTALENMPLPASSLAENIVSDYPNLKREEETEKLLCQQVSHDVRIQKVTGQVASSIEQDSELGELSQDLQSMLTERIKKSERRVKSSFESLKEEVAKGQQYWIEEQRAEEQLQQEIKQQRHYLHSLSCAKIYQAKQLVDHFYNLVGLSMELTFQLHEVTKLQEELSKKESYKKELPSRIHRLTILRSDYAYELKSLLDQLEECKTNLDTSLQITKQSMLENDNAQHNCKETMARCDNQLDRLKNHMKKEKQTLDTYADSKQEELDRWSTILKTIIGIGFAATVTSVGLAVFTGGLSLLLGGSAIAGTVGAIGTKMYFNSYRTQCEATMKTCRDSAGVYHSNNRDIDDCLQSLSKVLVR